MSVFGFIEIGYRCCVDGWGMLICLLRIFDIIIAKFFFGCYVFNICSFFAAMVSNICFVFTLANYERESIGIIISGDFHALGFLHALCRYVDVGFVLLYAQRAHARRFLL